MKIALVAGEASGDVLGAGLIVALKQRYPHAEFVGVAGPKMIAAGCNAWHSSDELAVMGLFEVAKHLPRLLRLRKKLTAKVISEQPDVFIGIDAPEFNTGLELRLREKGIKTVHYVSPSVWAWRQRRIKKIGKSVDLMLTLFPFEAKFYQDNGIPVTFVGHPLADDIKGRPNKAKARKQLGLSTKAPVVALLPGSRSGELQQLGKPFLETARKLQSQLSDVEFVLPCARPALRPQLEQLLKDTGPLPLHIIDADAQTAMAAADVVLIASGTATLEALLLRRPMVVAYALSPATYKILIRIVKIKQYSLPNLLAGKGTVVECIQDDATPEKMAPAVYDLLTRPKQRDAMLGKFAEVHKQLKQDASQKAADAIEKLLNQ